MKNPLFLALLFCCFLPCCKKGNIEQKVAEDLVVQIMVTGQWTVTTYTKGTTDITPEFSAYKFQFQKNRTVDALKNNTVEKSGSWDANASARTITSAFSNATLPLSYLNGTWAITNTTMTTVEANQTINGEQCLLKLAKQ